MDFFQSQQRAHTKTRLLIVYFVLAVAGILAAVYLVVALLFLRPRAEPWTTLAWLWQPDLVLYVTAAGAAVIALGSLYRLQQLAAGGASVARSLGGVEVEPEPRDPAERRLRNVVEEMALASGVPVPGIYVLPQENAINAFAAGHTTSDAVVAVTRGCLAHLTRDELQGVIAHEFSHLLNGDMRLNLRLIGILYGILCLAILGRILLHTRGRKNPLPVLGVGLVLIGSIGVFFGKLIKSAVSRQREFLADAAAVQFTRNPAGIAGALKKIGGWPAGARLQAAQAEEASHLFFGNGLRQSWLNLFSTHPPLAQRIRAIEPSFDGKFPRVTLSKTAAEDTPRTTLTGTRRAAPASPTPVGVPAAAFVAQVGRPTAEHLSQAAAFRDALPRELTAALHQPAGATGVVCALLLASDEPTRQAQLDRVSHIAGAAPRAEVERLSPLAHSLAAADRLLAVDLALPALRHLTREDYARFTQTLQALIEADRQIDLFEYTLQKLLRRHLAAHFEQPRRPVIQYYRLAPLARECAVLLSALAHLGQSQRESMRAAFRAGAQLLAENEVTLELLAWEQCNLPAVDTALDRLNQVAPALKRRLLSACAHTVMVDGQIQAREGELLRAIAEALDCPMPPLLGQACS
ncbi:MAG: M48 family metallopeptidase [Verrucomicrobia bacterium]|nr:M48 family metallopeptidase [Verrucomicrobiota bacterium]